MLKVSSIIINYNTSVYTIPCVKSILEYHAREFQHEIIVIDNASSEEDYVTLKNGIDSLASEKVKLIRSKVNLGFGGGNMLGVQYASNSIYYAFINNDTLMVDKNTLGKLGEFLDGNSQIAMCSPQMLDENKNFRITIDHFSSLQREILRRPLLESLFPKKYLDRKKYYESPTKVDYVQGSFMFVRAEDFNMVGGFDTNLFLYYEESDLCRRLLKNRNKLTYLYPDLNYIHYKSASINKNVAIKCELKISLLYYIKKHYGYWAHKILITHLRLRYTFTSLVKPKYFPLMKLLWQGAPLSSSLKQKQRIKE